MKKIILMLSLVVVAVCQAQLQLNSNLLNNPGFETTAGWDGTVYQRSVDPVPHSGNYCHFGGGAVSHAVTQTVETTNIVGFSATAQAEGQYSVEWGAFLASWPTDGDYSFVRLEQLDSGGAVLATEVSDDSPSGFTWVEEGKVSDLLSDTTALRFSIISMKDGGTVNDGCADDAFMQVIPRPVTFGSGGNQFQMHFVDIGHAENAADTNTGYGAVDYEYRIGKYEVTADQWAAVRTADSNVGDAFSFWSGSQPAALASWYEAAKFCNWLTSGSYSQGAYIFSGPYTLTAVDRDAAVAAYGTVYVLPSEDEWYKAAYFKSGGSGYTLYATGDSVPTAGAGGENYTASGAWDVGTGIVENNGTFDMNGNVWEWNESAFDGTLNNLAENRIIRGGSAGNGESYLRSSFRFTFEPPNESSYTGFRVAEITDPNLKTFGSGANAFDMHFVDIGYPGNASDTTGYGAVGYNYKIAKHEVTIDQITKSGIGDGDENYWNDGTRSIGVDAPASFISWNEAAQFCNWLTSGNTNSGAYQFDATGILTNVDRKSAVALYGEAYVIPSESEWYKAAFFKSDGSGYTLYASGNSLPALDVDSNTSGGAYPDPWLVGTGSVENNGTHDMNGNVWEWTESPFDGVLDNLLGNRTFRSAAYDSQSYLNSSSTRYGRELTWENEDFGCRIALISNSDKEPGAYVKWTVESPNSNPLPMIGTALAEYGTWVTNSVEIIIETNSTQYVNLGSAEGGATNWFTRLATNNTTVTWEWATNYWVSAGTSGSGSLNISDDWYVKGSNVVVLATPDPDWLFMGWSGDLAGDYTGTNKNLLVDEPKAFVATFSDDADGDGLLNSNETAIGTNPRNGDTDGDNFGDYFEVMNGGSPTVGHNPYVDYIRNNGGTFGLYESNVVVDVAIGQMALETFGGMADLSLQLMKSDDLVTWTNAAPPAEWSIPVESNKQFFRVRAEP